MKKTIILLILCLGLIASQGLTRSCLPPGRSAPALAAIRLEFANFSRSTAELCKEIDLIGQKGQKDGASVHRAKQALIDCRLHYKRIEFFLEYFFHSSALIYNHPAKYEVEEPYQEFEAPRGFQVMEELLFQNDVFSVKNELSQQALAVNESAKDLDALWYGFTLEDGQLLESLRIGLIRLITLDITGYDAPRLKSGIAESYEAMIFMQGALEPYLSIGSPVADSVRRYLNRSLAKLGSKSDFDHFDRMGFLTGAALPLQYYMGSLIRDLHLELNTVPALNYAAVNLFARNALSKNAFPGAGADTSSAIRELGRSLFFNTALSGNHSRSCATCHRPGDYFTDRLPKSLAYDHHSTVKRNAPSLYYAGFQYSQFWDGRARTLEEQVIDVEKNPVEMNAELPTVERRLQPLSIGQIAAAIASYIRSLAPMNSPFDRYLEGDRTAMTPDEVRGFNLFMGKAQCATCHFAPLFNGLRPPDFAVTEYEVLGVPASAALAHPHADSDQGRFGVFPISFYQQAFKTPTLRNIAVTGPYMHNGSFHSLKKVMDFYNRGGGKGLGLSTPGQTLAANPLRLSQKEIGQIIGFLGTLTDRPIQYSSRILD